jgi:glycosyltransferase involved in cell wall biosynthesis
MKDRPRISVAMATFNGALYLPEQLASLATQTLLPFELVVTDDGSSDRTEEIVKTFAATAPFPVHWSANHSRLGYRANFMRAVSLCTGDLIAFCDQDDIWYPHKFEIAAAAFSDPGVMLFHHEARVVHDGTVTSERTRKLSSVEPLVPMLRSAPWQHPFGYTEVFRASLRNYDKLWCRSIDFKSLHDQAAHDQWYLLFATVLGAIAFHPLPLADYRQHENNTFGIGVAANRGIGDKLKFLLENRTPVYSRLAQVANSRAELFTQAQSLATSQSEIEHFAVGAEAWRQLGIAYASRGTLYTRSLSHRLRAFLSLLRQRAYGVKGFWSFGRKALLKDFILGVALAPLVRRYGRSATGGDWNCVAGDGSAVALAYERLRH